MIRTRTLLLAALALITSCVPGDDVGRVASTHRRIVDKRELLHRLAPTLPDSDVEQIVRRAATGRSPPPIALQTPFTLESASEEDAHRAADCLTDAVYYEARSEPAEGQLAVAQVVLNRVRDRAFPHSVCGVVYQGSGRATGCQFSFTCDGSMNRAREPSAWDRARAVALAALNGSVSSLVGTATFYHSNAVSPWWAPSLVRIGAVGRHIFYRWPGQLERALGLRVAYDGREPQPAAIGRTSPGGSFDAGTRAVAFGVTVHRVLDEPPASDANAAAAVARVLVSSGVRIHVGGPRGAAAELPKPGVIVATTAPAGGAPSARHIHLSDEL